MEGRETMSMIFNSALRVNEEKRRSTRIPLQAKVRMQIDGRTIEGELDPAWRGHLLQLALAEPAELSEAQADATARETIEGRVFRVSIRKKQEA